MPDSLYSLERRDNSVLEKEDLTALHHTVGGPCIVTTSRDFRKAFLDHQRGLVPKLVEYVVSYIKKLRSR